MTTAPHDKLFKETFGKPENAAVELRAVLPPALLRQLELGSLTQVSGERIGRDLSTRYCDILYQATIGGAPGYIYLLLEHQSTVDPLMSFRVLEYVVKVLSHHVAQNAEKVLPLPAVIPIVVHHSESGWTAATEVSELFAPSLASEPEIQTYLPRLSFVLDDISRASDEELMTRAQRDAERIVPIVLWALRDARAADRIMASFVAWVGLLSQVFRSESGKDALISVFSYLSQAQAELSKDQLYTIAERVDPRAEELLMTFAEQCRQEGRQEGRAEEARRVLEKLLSLKFGQSAQGAIGRLEQAELPQLETWTERILTATTLEDVFKN